MLSPQSSASEQANKKRGCVRCVWVSGNFSSTYFGDSPSDRSEPVLHYAVNFEDSHCVDNTLVSCFYHARLRANPPPLGRVAR